jgi:cytidylate kinase
MAGFIIAVDGPAASGKGTIASRLARLYDYPYLDTGLLYRAVGVAVQNLADEAEAERVARALKPVLDDPALRGAAAGEAASRVGAYPGVRAALLDLQRAFAAQEPGAVLDGRDIGTVIAPHAQIKLFVTATAEVRAERRRKQLAGQGEAVTFELVLDDIRRRDARDQGRGAAPLAMADDAVLLDTTDLDIEAATDAARRIVEAARAEDSSGV